MRMGGRLLDYPTPPDAEKENESISRARYLLRANLLLLAGILVLAAAVGYLVVSQVSLREQTRALARQNVTLTQTVASIGKAQSDVNTALTSHMEAAREQTQLDLDGMQRQLADSLAQLETDLITKVSALRDEWASKLTATSTELSGDISGLHEDIAAFEKQSNTTVQEMQTRLSAQATDFQARLQATAADLQKAQDQLRSLGASVKQNLAGVDSQMKGALDQLTASMGTLQKDAAALQDNLSRLMLDAPNIYQQVRASVVQVKASLPNGEGTGSGFLYGSGQDHIVTADHVIVNSTSVRVITSTGETIEAKVVASNKEHDIALLELDRPMNAAPLPMTDSSKVVVGEPVLLVGTPLNEPGSATAGIISGLGRTESYNGYTVRGLMQYDAAANPGNSGGPLFNNRGEVVGISVAGVLPGNGNGINFAMPSNTIASVISGIVR